MKKPANMNTIKVIRKWSAENVRTTCIDNNLYTCGNNADYSEMLDFVDENEPTPENLFTVAADINEHSKENTIENIMFLLERFAVCAFFEITEEPAPETASKEQEREALRKIRELIKSVGGEQSYIGIAIDEKVLTTAECNIENDFALSPTGQAATAHAAYLKAKQEAEEAKQEAENAKKNAATLREDLGKARKEILRLERMMKDHTGTEAEEIERLNNIISDYMETCAANEEYITELRKDCDKIREELRKTEHALSDQKLKTGQAEYEILELKAKLYDLITQ